MQQKNFELLKNSDPAALEYIHAKYSRSIFWVGKQIIDDTFVVESLMQDAFLKLWEYREKIEDPMHIFFFLRVVMKRACFTYYTAPRNRFFKTVRSLEGCENYQDYLAGYDPADVLENLKDQESQQKLADLVMNVLPLLRPERRQLINLCLTYGFRYKTIAQVMGKGITETANEVKRAIEDIKKNVLRNSNQPMQRKITAPLKQTITEQQTLIVRMRCEENRSFDVIAKQLNLSQQQVHQEFATAYKLIR